MWLDFDQKCRVGSAGKKIKTTKTKITTMHKADDTQLADISHDNSHPKVTTKQHYCTMFQRISKTDKNPP